MDKNRIWVIGSVLVMVVVLVLGWIVGIQPQLAATAAANDQRASVEQTNVMQEAALAKLKEDFAGIDALKDELASLSQSVPTGTEAPAFINQLDALAIAHGVTLKGVTMADPQAYTPVAAPVAAETATDSDEGAEAEATPAPAPEPVPTAGVPPVTNAQITAENFASLGMGITVSGSYANVLAFVDGLQTGTRLFLVTGLDTVASTESPDQVDATITGLIYALVSAETATEVGAG